MICLDKCIPFMAIAKLAQTCLNAPISFRKRVAHPPTLQGM